MHSQTTNRCIHRTTTSISYTVVVLLRSRCWQPDSIQADGLDTRISVARKGSKSGSKSATVQPVGGGNQPVPQNKALGMTMIKFGAPPMFSGKQGEDAADWLELYESTAEYNRWFGRPGTEGVSVP